MPTSRCARLTISVIFVLAVFVPALATAAPASASTGTASFSGAVLGTVISVSSTFRQPSTGAGNYMIDTEIFDSSGKRVAQWSEQSWLGNYNTTRQYQWNTAGLTSGRYRVAQGIFTTDWRSNRLWVNDAGTVNLGSAVAPKWNLSATVNSGTTANVAATFVAPANFGSAPVILDTEIYSPAGSKVAQWTDKTTVGSGQSVTRNHSWGTGGKAAGTYTIKQGVFKPDWSGTMAWNGSTAKFSVASVAQSLTTPVTDVIGKLPLTPTNANPFWVDPSSPAAMQTRQWQSSRPADAALMNRIANGGAAVWLGGWNTDVKTAVSSVTNAATAAGKTPVFVAYNIPNRDCGSYSAGGANGGDAYRNWVASIAEGVGDKKAWVVLEPDALSQLDCLDSASRSNRLALLANAVTTLEAKPNLDVYLDAGHPGWHSASVMAERLRAAGVDKARGFSLNVSNFASTNDNANYGESVSALLSGKKYVVDTSRNGNGSNGEWCNPGGRAVGATPTTNTGRANADAYLWIKRPGESDGTCNGGPNAGQWWADYALGLAQSAWG